MFSNLVFAAMLLNESLEKVLKKVSKKKKMKKNSVFINFRCRDG